MTDFIFSKGGPFDSDIPTINAKDLELIASAVWDATLTSGVAKDLLIAAADESLKARQMQTNKAVISEDGLTVTIYADDDVTVLHSFAVSADKNTRTPV